MTHGLFPLYLPLTKADADQRIVEGIASSPTFDSQPGELDGKLYSGDVIEPQAIEAALADYMAWANIREMHAPSAVGVALEARVLDKAIEIDDKLVEHPLYIKVRVVDDVAWQKVKAGVYKGFSIGGRVIKAVVREINGVMCRVITALKLTEISLVDRPANPDARILVFKMEAPMDPTQLAELMKAADASKVVAMLQQLRNDAEVAGELDDAELFTNAIRLVQQAAGESKDKPAEAEAAPEEMPEATAEMAQAARIGDLAKRAGAVVKWDGHRWQWVLKAGRMFSMSNQSSMHTVIKALAAMLANAGDAQAAKIVAVYDGGGQEDGVEMAAWSTTLVKALEPSFKGLADTLANLDRRVAVIEKQPAPGGPVLRAIEKIVAVGQNLNVDQRAAALKKAEMRVAELRRQASTEPNDVVRQQYRRDLEQAEADLAALK
jgi:phage head maturation protease